MKNKLLLAAGCCLLATAFCLRAQGQATAFTYQGRLNDGANTANGLYDLRFALYDSTNSSSTLLAGPVTNAAVAVSNGLFTTRVDLGNIFTGASCWLEIAVSTNGANAYAALAPFQPITPTPTALFAASASNLLGSVSASQLNGSIAATNLSGTVPLSQLPASVLTNGASSVTLTGTFSGNGAGLTNVALLNASQTFNGANTFNGPVTLANPTNTLTGQLNLANQILFLRSNSDLHHGLAYNGGSFTNFPNGTLMPDGPVLWGYAGGALATFNTLQPALQWNANGVIVSNLTLIGTLTGNGSGLTNLNTASLTGIPGTVIWQSATNSSQQAQSNTGYVTTNSGLTTVTLPASPNVGDIVRVTGVGAGGWEMAQNSGQVILTGTIPGTSGVGWTAQATSQNWASVASSSDGTKLVAANNDGQIYTSTNSGLTWTNRGVNANWSSVACSGDGTKIVAAIDEGPILTSTNSGVSWATYNNLQKWSSVASSSDGTKLAATIWGGQIYVSSNSGSTWTAQGSSEDWMSVASSSDGTKLIAAAYGGQTYTSSNSGSTWTAHLTTDKWYAVASSADGTKLVAAINGGQIYISCDSGNTWTARGTDNEWQSVTSSADGTKLAAAVLGGQIYISYDSGATWAASATSQDWTSISCSADGTKLIAAIEGGQLYTSLPSTSTGTSGYLTGSQYSAVELQYIGVGQWLVLSYNGTISAN